MLPFVFFDTTMVVLTPGWWCHTKIKLKYLSLKSIELGQIEYLVLG